MSLHIPTKEIMQLERHKRFQIAVSIGTVTCVAVGMIAPQYQLHVAVVNVLTNLIWIWEK